MRYPIELYRPSPRPYRGLPELEYSFHDRAVTVTQCGRLCFGHRKINLSVVFAAQNVVHAFHISGLGAACVPYGAGTASALNRLSVLPRGA
jgi:hypothetical protein